MAAFYEAATRLHVTQSTVSSRIQGLEAYLGATLFVRNRSGATLHQPANGLCIMQNPSF